MDGFTARGVATPEPAKPQTAPAGSRAAVWFARQVALQTGRTFVWAPVAAFCGVHAYFALQQEPSGWFMTLAGLATVLALILRVQGKLGAPWLLVALILAGAGWAQVMATRGAPVALPASTGKITMSGWVERVETRPRGQVRFVLRLDEMKAVKPEFRPRRIRVSGTKAKAGHLRPGDYVRFAGWGFALTGPVAPGAWDFGRMNWLSGITAGARAADMVQVDAERSHSGNWRRHVETLRQTIKSRVYAALPEREAGFAIALITGERAGIDKQTREALQVSGLAHILAISGLHMSLVAGGVFWLVRALLALSPGLALNWPIKKFAAVAGLGAAGFYLVLSGQAISAQRAFIMLAVMFIAVLAGRSALSMRNLAIAALIVLAIAPHAALTASFQMSFLAVAGLIGFYEAGTHWQGRIRAYLQQRSFAGKLGVKLMLFFLALSLTTIIASVFTALPAAWHFNRFAAWSLPANLFAMPAVTLLVMPGAVASVLAMPLGLEWAPLQVMRYGLDIVLWSANTVSGWPGAARAVPSMLPVLAFVAGVGVLWLGLWRGSLRWAGGMVALASMWLAVQLPERPDVYVERSARTMAARLDGATAGQGRLVPVHPRRGTYPVERWLLADGDAASIGQAAARGGWVCEGEVCSATVAGKSVIWIGKKAKPPETCKQAAIVVAAEPLRRACGRSAKAQDGWRERVVIDRFDAWRRGAHALYVRKDGAVRVETVRGWQGKRPWAMRPLARKKVLVNPPAPKFQEKGSAGQGGASE